VAAAFEGIVLGIPAIAVSQQSSALEMGFLPGRRFDFEAAAAIGAELVRRALESPLRPGTLLNVNCPGAPPRGVEITRLGKRVYEDELKLIDEDKAGRRRYRIYGFAPSHVDEEGTDLTAVARGFVSVTPVHFDLTDLEGIDALHERNLASALSAALPAAAGAGDSGGPA
jgi:5'-nucleotidase